jgi:hypothetical protein
LTRLRRRVSIPTQRKLLVQRREALGLTAASGVCWRDKPHISFSENSMKFIRYSIVVDDSSKTPEQLKEALRGLNPWVAANNTKFKVVRGYYPKELVITTDDLHTMNVLSSTVFTLIQQEKED